VYGEGGGDKNWAEGYCGKQAELVESVFDIVMTEVETCDCLQGFQLTLSLAGGTGGGLGSLLISKIREEYSKSTVSTYSVFHSSGMFDSIIEPYNVRLSITKLIDGADHTFLFDNKALCDMCYNTLGLVDPTYDDLNHLVCLTMSGITSYPRFPDQRSYDISIFTLNMVPFERLHFFILGFVPLISGGSQEDRVFGVRKLLRDVFGASNVMVACDPSQGSYLTAAAVFRGCISKRQVERMLTQNRNSSSFTGQIPKELHTYFYDIPLRGIKVSVTSISNSTAIKEPLKHISQQFTAMCSHMAYWHYYIPKGLEDTDLFQADEKLRNLVSDYNKYQEAIVYGNAGADE
jgi:tubulin beta